MACCKLAGTNERHEINFNAPKQYCGRGTIVFFGLEHVLPYLATSFCSPRPRSKAAPGSA